MMLKEIRPADKQPIMHAIGRLLREMDYSPDVLPEVARLCLIVHGLAATKANPNVPERAELLSLYYRAIADDVIGHVQALAREQEATP